MRNPVVLITHVVAVALGVWLGFWVMGAVTPDLPPADAEPGVAATGELAGDDLESLCRASNRGAARVELNDQQEAGAGIVRLHVEPGSIEAETSSADGAFETPDVHVAAIERIVALAAAERPAIDLSKVQYADLIATERGPRWYVQLVSDDPGLPPPWTYGAPVAGEPITAGPGEPTQIPSP